jgi:hypothetical protein
MPDSCCVEKLKSCRMTGAAINFLHCGGPRFFVQYGGSCGKENSLILASAIADIHAFSLSTDYQLAGRRSTRMPWSSSSCKLLRRDGKGPSQDSVYLDFA